MNTQRTRLALSLLAGLALTGVATQAQISTNLLSETTFDEAAGSPWSYGYFYPGSIVSDGLGFYSAQHRYYLPEDVDMTNGMYYYMFDNTFVEGMTGYGTGTGAPLFRTQTDPAAFVNAERENYIFTFDARVAGLAEGQTSANAEMQVQFYAPNPEGGDPLKTFQVNIPFAPTNGWQTFRFTLAQGSVSGDTSEAVFAQRHAETSDVRFNVNLHEPHNRFGFDGDNELFIDNVKLEVVDKPTVIPQPVVGVPIAAWNFDDTTVWYKYDYNWSANDYRPLQTSGNNANGADPNTLGVDGGSGWWLNLDTTELANLPPAWAGGGTGGGGPIDATKFDTADLASYRVTFDARVIGLAEGRTTSSGELQLFIAAADDVITVDENTDTETMLQVNFGIALISPEWQTYTFTLNKGAVGENGSLALFGEHFSQVSEVRAQLQLPSVGSEAEWGYDAENTIVMDNFKLERLYPESNDLGTITATKQGDNLVLTWTAANATLQSATTLNGPWAPVDGAVSGHSTPLTGAARFFRLVPAAQ